MDSLKFMVTWSLFLACCILVVNIRPSLAMPIEGDQNSDKFEGIYDLLTQRIQNLSQRNDESIGRSHIPMALSENSTFEDTNNSNATTIPSRNSNFSRLNQQSEKNTPVVPMATGYAGNILHTLAAGKFPEEKQTFQSRNQPGAIQQLLWQQSTRNQPVWQHNSGNSAIIKLSTTKSMAGNRFLGSLSTTFRNQTAGATQSLRYQMTGNSPIMNNSTVGSHFNGNASVTNSSTGNYQSQSSQYKIAGKEPVWKQSAGDQIVTGSSLSNTPAENLFQGNLSKNNSQLSWYQVAQNQPLWKQNAGNQFAAKYLRTNPLPSIPFPSEPGIYPSAAAQSSWYQMARNQFIAKQDVGNQMLANLSLGNLTAGNRFVSNRLYTKPFSGNQLVKTPQFLRYQMAGNYPLWKQNAGNQVVANSSIGISTARDRFQGSILATKTMAGTVPLTKAVTGKQMAGNLPAKTSQVATLMTMNPKVQISPVVQKWPVTANLQTGGLQVRGSLASARQASPLILPSPSKAGLTYNRGQSSIYRQPSSYDSKGAIYAPSLVNFGQPPKLKNTAENVKKSNIFSPFVNRPWFQSYPPMGNRPTFQPRYTGYPDFFQHGRRDYQTTSPHQRLQEHHSKVGNVRDELPTKKKFKHHEASKKSSKKSTTNSLTKFNTIQIKLPDKLSTSNSATLSQSSSLDDDTVTEELASASGSGFEFPNDLTDADGFEEPEDFSVSGSGNDDGYLNPGLIGGTSDIAFMLADAKNRPPAFPAPGLPMNLTRQQAIDIYKSAMYFAGLMGADSIDGYSEESGDIGNDADDDNDDDDKSDHSFPDEDDNDVTITDSDIKEALDASSGELDASGQQRADVDSSGSQPETTGSDNSTSKDEGGVTQKQPSESQAKVNSSSLEESTNRTEGNQSQDGKSEAPQESAASLQTPPPVVSDTNQLSNDKQSVSEADDDDDTPPPDETLTKAAQANYAADQQAEKAMYFMSHTRQSGAYSSSSKRAIICRGTTQKISCPPDKRLRILNADYGDTGDAGCLKESNPEPSGPCRTPGAFEIVRRECDGYEDCALPASNEVFGDACPDANKYLDVNYDCVNNAVAPAPAAYSPASYPAPPPYVNPLPPPVSYAPAPYQVPPPASYGGLPDLLPPSPYVAPNPCNPCNTCAQCALPACSPCGSTCQILTCGPQIPAKLQPLWQQFNERTADMSRMEMAALIISPLPKLAPTKAPESSGAAEGSESGEPTLDEDALYEENKKSKIQRIKPQKTSKKTSLTAAKKKADKNSDNEQGFLRNTDSVTSSGDASSGGSST